jgi:spore coat polysaccharide biosynthesis protein SpsF
MTVGCIIQARMGSSRLPGKVMINLDKKNPLLYYVISQVKFCKKIEKIIVATTINDIDNKIVEYCNNLGISTFRGSEYDVLDRFYNCAKKFGISTIVRITADNPLVDPSIIDSVIEKFHEGNASYDYVSNFFQKSFPKGTEVEVFSIESLCTIWNLTKKPYDREHVTPYFYNNSDKFKIANLKNSKDLSHLRFSVDTENDLKLVKAIISKINKKPIHLDNVLTLISKDSEFKKLWASNN